MKNPFKKTEKKMGKAIPVAEVFFGVLAIGGAMGLWFLGDASNPWSILTRMCAVGSLISGVYVAFRGLNEFA